MELKTALSIMGRRIWLIVLCAIVGGGAAFFANRMIVPEYEARAVLAVNQLSSDGRLTNYDNLLANELLARGYAEMMSSRPVLSEVIGALALDTSPGELENRVDIALVPQTQLMQLVVTDSDPQRAADTANTIVAVFREQNEALLARRYSASRQSLEDELDAAKGELDEWAGQVDWLRSAQGASPSDELRHAEQMLNRARNSYAALADAIARVRIAETQVTDNIDVIEAAYPSYDPVWPNPVLNLVVATIAGALLGVFIALLAGEPRPSAPPAAREER